MFKKYCQVHHKKYLFLNCYFLFSMTSFFVVEDKTISGTQTCLRRHWFSSNYALQGWETQLLRFIFLPITNLFLPTYFILSRQHDWRVWRSKKFSGTLQEVMERNSKERLSDSERLKVSTSKIRASKEHSPNTRLPMENEPSSV